MSGHIRYAYLDDQAVVFNDRRAYRHDGTGWRPMDWHEAVHKARLLTKEEFDRYAGPAGASLPIT